LWVLAVAAPLKIVAAPAADTSRLPEAPESALPAAAELDVRRDPTVTAVERVMPAVVNIATRKWVGRGSDSPEQRLIEEFYGYRRQPQAQVSRGSGVVIDSDGYVLTNVHVVRDVSDIYVQFPDSGKSYPAERISLSESKDIAVLKILAPATNRFRAVRLAKPDDLLLGETVLTLGNPFGLGGSVSRGILSSKSRRPDAALADGQRLDIPDWLQTDAAINPGNSGGPLVNLRGELIGINVAVLRPDIGAQGIGFAIPVKRITEAMSETLSGESFDGLWFGARIKPETTKLSVTSVQVGSPAEKAGLRVEDVILEVDTKPAGSLIDFNRALVAANTERAVRLGVRRNGVLRQLTLRLLEESEFFNGKLVLARTGLTLKPLDGRNAGAGLAVASVESGSPAARARIQPGMIVTSYDGETADDLVSLAKAVHQKPKGEAINLRVWFQQDWRAYEGDVALPVR